jgi:hypothetical protein
MKSYVGEPIRYKIDRLLTNKIKKYAASENASLFMVLLGCVKVLLHKYSGQTNIVVGSPVAGRNHFQLEDLVGFFVNTVAIRSTIDPHSTFENYLRIIIDTTINAYEHQLYPFDCLVDELNLERDISRSPLFDVTVQLLNVAAESADTRFSLGKARAERYFEAEWKRSQFDLSFFFREEGEELFCIVEYNNSIYRKDRIERMIGHLLELLKTITSKPGVPIKELNYIPTEELKQLAQFGAGVKTQFPESVLDLFKIQVELHPVTLAVQDHSGQVSYLELDQKSNKIGSFLTQHTNEQSVVAVLTRSKVMLTEAMTAIFKSHRIYLPLDSDLPYERIRYILGDTKASCIITDSTLYHLANKLQYESLTINYLLCPDVDDPLTIEEPVSDLMTNELWSYVAQQANDEIDLGGWKSSFTGLPFSKEEMDEYGDNILQKLTPWLTPETNVLEIGCSSGITLFKIAPHVKTYFGTDLSADILVKTQKEVETKGLMNVKLEPLMAHNIDQLSGTNFDVIIINSVIQSFSGYNYLHHVIEKVIALASDNAIVFFRRSSGYATERAVDE